MVDEEAIDLLLDAIVPIDVHVLLLGRPPEVVRIAAFELPFGTIEQLCNVVFDALAVKVEEGLDFLKVFLLDEF